MCENRKCKHFGVRPMQWTKRPNHIDKFSWRCTSCTTYKSIRTNSFFSYFKMCEKLCKGDQGLKVHMAWHRKKLKKRSQLILRA